MNRTEIERLEEHAIIYGESKFYESSNKKKSIYDWTIFQEELGYSPDESPRDINPPLMRELRAYMEKYW